MRDVATLAGVGVKTVSRVINGEPHVSPATIERVLRAVADLNFQPDLHAGNLRRTDRRTRTIGLLVGSVSNPFSGALHRAVEDRAAARGVAVFASSLDDDPDQEERAVDAFLKRRVDGLILTTIKPSQAYLVAEQKHGTPLVFIDREPSGLEADAVVSSNAQGAAEATRHLIGHGHRRIAYLGDRPEIQTARERKRGFMEELGRAGIATGEVAIVEGLADEAEAEAAVLLLFSAPHPPTAIFSAQNLITMGALRALRRLGMHRLVALVGFDDLELADLLEPGLTVVAQDASKIGHLAAERIFARLDGALPQPQTFVVPTNLIPRGSGEIRPS
ncbi:LacI family DNA-binding transcriptional regulator [Leifsonia sp. LS-T14]|uniref:LacI family DNA-binding transcriptional regulator n=1 Tax=unclassified Leifsonia TaxID=2663824 RepID=UPI0035A5DE53